MWVSFVSSYTSEKVVAVSLSYCVQYRVIFDGIMSRVCSISQEICTRFLLCCGYTLTDFPISTRLTSLALWQSNDCPSASKATLMNMDKYFMWINYERLHNHTKAKHNKTVCIFLGIYCIADNLPATANSLEDLGPRRFNYALVVATMTMRWPYCPDVDIYVNKVVLLFFNTILMSVYCMYHNDEF